MMKSLLRSHSSVDFESERWMESQMFRGVRFAVRRPSLAQRIELTRRVRELVLANDFLASGNEAEKLEGALADLLVRRLYIEWGLAQIEGLTINGVAASVESLIASGPEQLAEEIATCVQRECGLSEEERKNS
jgi:hypothetical protein